MWAVAPSIIFSITTKRSHVNIDFLGTVILGIVLLIGLAVVVTFILLGIFVIKALIKYIKSGDVRKVKSGIRKSLGEVYLMV